MRTMFSRDLFWSPRLGADDISSLPPDQRRDKLDDYYTNVYIPWDKAQAWINKNGGVAGMKAALGSDYDTFMSGYNVYLGMSDKIQAVIGKTSMSDPSVWNTITQTDFDLVDQWKYVVSPLEDIISKHQNPQPAAPQTPAASAPPTPAPAFAPSAPAASSSPNTLVLAGLGALGLGALVYALA